MSVVAFNYDCQIKNARGMPQNPQVRLTGVDTGRYDPYVDTTGAGEVAGEGTPTLLVGSGIPSGRCQLNGFAVECEEAFRLLQSGAAAMCPGDCGPRFVTTMTTYTDGRTETRRGFVNDPFFNVNERFTGLQARLARRGFNDGMDRGFSWAVRNAVSYASFVSPATDGRQGGFASFFAPQDTIMTGFNLGPTANFDPAKQKILRTVYDRINQADCKNWINSQLKEWVALKGRGNLDTLLQTAQLNSYSDNLTAADMGISDSDRENLRKDFQDNSNNKIRLGVTLAPDYTRIYLSDDIFQRALMDNRYLKIGGNRDTASHIVHELFHVAFQGDAAHVIINNDFNKDIGEHCGLPNSVF